MHRSEKLFLRTKLLYSTGDLSTSIPLAILMFFQLYFLTDVAHLRPDLAGWAMGQMLFRTGYVTPTDAIPVPHQPPQAIQAIRWFIGPIPIALLIISIIFAWFYPITREAHASMREQLAARGDE